LSDEFGTNDLSIYSSKAVKRVLRNYWRPDLAQYGDKVTVLPLGFANGRNHGGTEVPEFSNRSNVWSFAGSKDRVGREQSLMTLRSVTPHTEYAKPGWSSPHIVQGPDYVRLLLATKFVPCFRGSKALESYRFYEALEAGAIPIYVPSESAGCKDEFSELFGKHPFLGFPSWTHAAEMLPKLVGQTEIMEKHQQTLQGWWVAKKAEIRAAVGAMFPTKV
jgi:hypothetical protein